VSRTVPAALTDVTPAWMTDALAATCPGAVVERVDLGDIDVGTTTRALATLTYRSGTGPKTVFLKGQGSLDHRLVLALIRGLRPEAWFFSSAERPRVESPEVYACAVDSPRLRTLLVLEDITARGATPHIATTPLTPEQVAAGLVTLARVHTPYWNRPLPGSLKFLRPWSLATLWSPFAVAGGVFGPRKLGGAGRADLLPGSLRGPAALARSFARCAAIARTGPLTVLHGDAHVGNSYRLPDGTVGFFDWQLTRTGSYMHDVSYFMISALSVADRREHQRELLAGYLRELGVAAPPMDDAWLRFRATAPYGLGIFLQTLMLGGYQIDAVSETCIERFGAAVDDLRAGEAQRSF
jgi:hypothetical protein